MDWPLILDIQANDEPPPISTGRMFLEGFKRAWCHIKSAEPYPAYASPDISLIKYEVVSSNNQHHYPAYASLCISEMMMLG